MKAIVNNVCFDVRPVYNIQTDQHCKLELADRNGVAEVTIRLHCDTDLIYELIGHRDSFNLSVGDSLDGEFTLNSFSTTGGSL